MRRICSTLTALAAAVLALGVTAAPANAATGEVVVFEVETAPLTVYTNPAEGCYKLPAAAHVLTNRTDLPLRIHADPLCLDPGLTVEPGYGSHVAAGSGSFSI
ncbi:hypothetical protein [Streptomyces sp. HC307]|uniref:hypothetical protein n=1 Tax=Streptomyces flavusporus TaxID=3385496 RepID=UPI0039170009